MRWRYNRLVTYGRWEPLEGVEIPDGPGLLQARIEGLVQYPTGKSAMIYYDGGEQLSDAVERLRARARAGNENVLVRFAPHDSPADELVDSLRQFAARFGSAPRWNLS
jgi:hypothetical protein